MSDAFQVKPNFTRMWDDMRDEFAAGARNGFVYSGHQVLARMDAALANSLVDTAALSKEQKLENWERWCNEFEGVQAKPAEVPTPYLSKYLEFADEETPKAQEGTWTLTAPDGRTWQGDSPLRCVAIEMRERVSHRVQLGRIARGLLDPPPEPEGPPHSKGRWK